MKKASELAKIPSGYIVGIIVALCILLVLAGYGQHAVSDFIGIIYPAYMSFKAVETPNPHDDTQWLTYWVVWTYLRVFRYYILDHLLSWVPGYFLAKLMFLLWLTFPEAQGAHYLYQSFVGPFLRKHEGKIDEAISIGKDAGSQIAQKGTNIAKQTAVENAGDIAAASASLMAEGKKNA